MLFFCLVILRYRTGKQAPKLVWVMGHLSGKFEVLTVECQV